MVKSIHLTERDGWNENQMTLKRRVSDAVNVKRDAMLIDRGSVCAICRGENRAISRRRLLLLQLRMQM